MPIRSSPHRRAVPVRAARLATSAARFASTASLAIVAAFGPSAALAQCWETGPAHGQNSASAAALDAAIAWDPDGIGASGAWLVVSAQRFAGSLEAWTGSDWLTLPGMFNFPPDALEVYNGQLCAGGIFNYVAGNRIWCVARWSGSSWDQLGAGIGGNLDDHVNALQSYGGFLWAGGHFASPENPSISMTCAVWSGFGWTSVYVPGEVMDFAVINSQLYAAVSWGSDHGAVYRYTGSGFARVGDEANANVLAVEGYLGQPVAGGVFSQYGSEAASGVARWNGSAWAPMGQGVGYVGAGNAVSSLREYNGVLIAAGRFNTMDGLYVGNVAAWNGVSWSGLGSGIPYNSYNYVSAVELYDGRVAVVGDYDFPSGLATRNVALWNGGEWRPLIEGVNAPIRAFFNGGTTLYAGGDLDFSWNGDDINHLVGWDGTSVYNVAGVGGSPGVNGRVNALAQHTFVLVQGPKMIVGGDFTSAGGVTASNVAAFGLGTTLGWEAVGAGFNAPVTALASHNRVLYAAGAFTASGATPLPHFARYSSGWVDAGFGGFGTVVAMASLNGRLVIGGVPGGADGVATWDGVTLSTYGTADGQVYALTSFENDLIVGGAFGTIDGQPVFGIARRNSTTGQWSAMGQGFPGGTVLALVVHDNQLYAGGSLVPTLGSTEFGLAVWTGSDWAETCAGAGLDGRVYALASWGGELHVGGDFQGYVDNGTARLSPYWAVYSGSPSTAAPALSLQEPTLSASYPNPARSVSRLEYTLASRGHATLSVYDARGRKVRTLQDGVGDAGTHRALWDGRDDTGRPSAAGIYFYRLEADGRVRTRQMVLIR